MFLVILVIVVFIVIQIVESCLLDDSVLYWLKSGVTACCLKHLWAVTIVPLTLSFFKGFVRVISVLWIMNKLLNVFVCLVLLSVQYIQFIINFNNNVNLNYATNVATKILHLLHFLLCNAIQLHLYHYTCFTQQVWINCHFFYMLIF